MLKKIILITLIGITLAVTLAYFRYIHDKPYNLLADSKNEIHEGVRQLNNEQLLVVILGANWCPECRYLASEIERDPLKSLNGSSLLFVKVDVNGWDRNMDIVNGLGNPASGGIPAIAIIDNSSRIIATRTGKQLAADKKIMGSYFNYFNKLASAYINNEIDINQSNTDTIKF